jgi:hypothetical protein
MKRLLFAIFLLLAATCGRAVAQTSCVGPPYTFAPGQIASSSQVNADFITLYSCMNTALFPPFPNGLSTPATVAQATFPGSVFYEFPSGLYVTGAVEAGYANANSGVTAGDLSASRTATTAELWLANATIDYGISHVGIFTAAYGVEAPVFYSTVYAAPGVAASPQPVPSPYPSSSPGFIVLEPTSQSNANVTIDSAGTVHAPTFSGSGSALTGIPLTGLVTTPDVLYDASGTAHAGHTVYTQTATTIANGAYSGSVTVTLAGAAQYTSATTYSPVCSDVPVTGFSGNVAVVIAVPQNGTGFQVYLFSTGTAASSTQNVNVYCTAAGY